MTENNDYFTTIEEYDPQISKEMWVELVKDKSIFVQNALIFFACLKDAGVASCTELSQKYGRTKNFYNNNNWQTGERVYKKTNCPLCEREEGGDRFWSVCCLGKKLNNGQFAFKIREDLLQAFEETKVLEGIELLEKNFTWVLFYKEMAEKILNYKDRQSELAEITYNIGDKAKYLEYKNVRYEKMHPFAVFGIFNRDITIQNRIEICKYFKSELNIKNEIPSDFDSIPHLNNQNSWWGNLADSSEVNNNWELFDISVSENINEERFCKYFDNVLEQKGAKWSLSMGLFWINPHNFMPLDKNSREYLEKIGIEVFSDKELNGKNYLFLLEKIKNKIANNEIKEKNFLEISYNAWKKDNLINNKDNEMGQTNELRINLTEKLKKTHNLILHGAPGTGKTFLAKEVAHAMDCTENEIGFVQFHPSYDYTDFVEGLRPIQSEENGNIGFERKDGVFKEFCKRALQSSKTENGVDNFEECWLKLVEKLNEEDFIDVPLLSGNKNIRIELNEYGTGLANRTYEDNNYSKGQWIQGKSKFFSKEQLYNIYKGLPGVPAGGHDNYRKAVVQFMKKDLGLKDYVEAETILQTKPFVFIIDEINRGEVSKIFGELFYSIDTGYRGEKGKVFTQYQNLIEDGDLFKKGFFVPENVYIIGTMNDIDRSVESMDFAFRRRFAWKEIKAEENTQMLNSLDDDLREKALTCMQNLNNAIYNEETKEGIEGLNSSYHIGASYFLKLNDFEGGAEEKFAQLWDYHLDGLLREYLRGTENIEDNIDVLKNAYMGIE